MSGELQGPAPNERPEPTGRRNKQGIRIDPEVEAEAEPRRTLISALVKHEPGVLAQVSGLFSRKQFNIESLTVGPTHDESLARITLVVEEPDPGIDQIEKQLETLIPVVSVDELEANAVSRGVLILKVDGDEPDKVHAITEMFNGRTVDAGPETITVEITGDEQKIDDAIDAYGQFGIRELVRTGQAALSRGKAPTAKTDFAGSTETTERTETTDATETEAE